MTDAGKISSQVGGEGGVPGGGASTVTGGGGWGGSGESKSTHINIVG